MQIKFNPSGFSFKNGMLRLRADVYIDDPTAKTYPQQYIHFPAKPIPSEFYDKNGELIESLYNPWLLTMPKRLNPALCYFFAVPELIDLTKITEHLKEKVFTPDNLATIDYCLAPQGIVSAHLISPFMRKMPKLTDQKVRTKDLADLLASTKTFLAGKIIDLVGGGKVLNVQPESISIGTAVANYGSSSSTQAMIDAGNPSTANGTIDTWKTFFKTGLDGVDFEVWTVAMTGNNGTSNDGEAIGAVAGGSEQTFSPFTTAVSNGDYAGAEWSGGQIEKENSGGSGYWYDPYPRLPCIGNTFLWLADRTFSLLGTGTEAGGVGLPIMADDELQSIIFGGQIVR